MVSATFLAISYFVSRFIHRTLGLSIELWAWLAFPAGAALLFVLFTQAAIFFLWSSASEEDRRTLITFSALVLALGGAVFIVAQVVGTFLLTELTSVWSRFFAGAACAAGILVIAWLGFFRGFTPR